jgi:hypothetical protein
MTFPLASTHPFLASIQVLSNLAARWSRGFVASRLAEGKTLAERLDSGEQLKRLPFLDAPFHIANA